MAMPLTDALVQLPVHICRCCPALASRSPFSWIPTVLSVRWSLGAHLDLFLLGIPVCIASQDSKRVPELSKWRFFSPQLKQN